jgi:chromosome segregation ATPase
MKLLNSKLVDEKSEQRKIQQIRDGELIAKEIDSLRENLGKERVQYGSSIRQMQEHFQEFTQSIENKRIELETQVNRLEERKRKALEPILKKNLHFLEKENELLLRAKVTSEAKAEWERQKAPLEQEIKELTLKSTSLDTKIKQASSLYEKLSVQSQNLEEKNSNLEDYLKIQDKEVERLNDVRRDLQKTNNELGILANQERGKQQAARDYLENKETELSSLKTYLVDKEFKLNKMENKLNKLVDSLTIKKKNLDLEVKDLMKKRQEFIKLNKLKK